MKQLFKLLFLFSLAFAMPFTAFATDDSKENIYTEQKPSFVVSAKEPQFTIQLKSNPTTGYSWFLREYDSRFIEPVSHRFQAADNKKMVGAPGFELWTFKMKPAAFTVPLQTLIRFVYVRPWESLDQTSGMAFWVSTAK